jgi:DNA-binding transcriptional LysR family regulator
MKSVLDSRQLLAARVLAKTGSFTLAGQQLSLTQSAVSHAIKALEEEVECRLFTRTGRGVTVTAAGKQFLQYTEQILEQMDTARTLVAPRAGRGKERLRLGVSPWSREFILPVVLPVFHREFPNKLVAIESGDFTRNLDLLDSGLLDLAFTVRPSRRPGLEFLLLFEDELKFIVAPSHPWARRGRVDLAELGNSQLLLYPGTYNLPALLAEYFTREKLPVRHGVELNEPEDLKALVRTGQAVGVMSTGLVSADLAARSLIGLSVGHRPLIQQWGVAHDRKRELAPMERRLIELYRQAVPGIISRVQGAQPEALEKKEDPSVMAIGEAFLKCSGVAMLAAGAYNFLSDSIAWENLGSILSAAS